MALKLKKFQKDFEKAVEDPKYDTVCLSGPRSLGKTWAAARILTRCLSPGDVLNQPGMTYILGAATLPQANMTFGFIREALEPCGEFRFIETTTRLAITHKPTNTRLRVISSNAKASFGLVRVPLVVIDEPGALEIVGGQMLSDSLFTAQGKVGSRLKLVLIGTLAPMGDPARALVARHCAPWDSGAGPRPALPRRPADVGPMAHHPKGESAGDGGPSHSASHFGRTGRSAGRHKTQSAIYEL